MPIPRSRRALVEHYGEALDWVRSLGVTVGETVTVLGYGRGCATDMANYLLACERLVRERGELLVGASAQRLLLEDGSVVGAEIRTAAATSGRSAHARRCWRPAASAAIRCCARSTSIRWRADLPLRANPHSIGDGLRLGLSAGAAFGPAEAGFYGHLDPVAGGLRQPVRVHRPDLLPQRARRPAEPRGPALLRRDDRRPPQHAVRARAARGARAARLRPARPRRVDDGALRRGQSSRWTSSSSPTGAGPGPPWRTSSRSSRPCRTSGGMRGPRLATRCSSSTASARPARPARRGGSTRCRSSIRRST